MGNNYVTFEGTGRDLAAAKEQLYAEARKYAEEEGITLPSDAKAVDYVASVRKRGTAYVQGKRKKDEVEALKTALKAAKITDYDSETHRTRLTGRFDLRQQTPKGKPSGAAPSQDNDNDITDLF